MIEAIAAHTTWSWKLRICDFLSPKLVPSLKSKNPNPKRKMIIQNSKDQFIWDQSSCFQKWTTLNVHTTLFLISTDTQTHQLPWPGTYHLQPREACGVHLTSRFLGFGHYYWPWCSLALLWGILYYSISLNPCTTINSDQWLSYAIWRSESWVIDMPTYIHSLSFFCYPEGSPLNLVWLSK